MKLTLDDCLKLYEEEGIMGLVEKVKEISFKAGQAEGYHEGFEDGVKDGYRAGQREVVEWFNARHVAIYDNWIQTHMLEKDTEWQAFKKERGL